MNADTLTPCRDAFEAAKEAYEAEETEATEAALDAARDAYRDSDEPRIWMLREEGYDYTTFEASSVDEALAEAESNVDRANYPTDGTATYETLYIDVHVYCEDTDESGSRTVECEADEPDCIDGHDHDWRRPHAILGGLKENPGVQGHGGGVIIEEVCMHCGCARTTDTWAQNRSTGEQGLTSVEYEPSKYADEIAAMEGGLDGAVEEVY